MSGKTLNSEGIMKLLSCDVVYDWNEQSEIRDALRANLNVIVLAHERNPYKFKGRGCTPIFDGAVKTPIEVIRHVMADDWLTEPKRNVKSMVVQYVSLFHQGWSFVKAIHNGKDIMEFQSKDEAEAWIADHPFVSDPHDVIKKISYQVRRFEHAYKPTKYQP
jgi:hypothetical protein